MNFLKLVQTLAIEAGTSGEIVTVVNPRGETARLVHWVQRAYQDLCIEEPTQWMFLRKPFLTQLVPGQGAYTPANLGISDLATWDADGLRVAVAPTLADETRLAKRSWNDFRDEWLFSSKRTIQSRPLNCTVTPDFKLQLAPIPDQAYWAVGEYVAAPEDLQADADIPVIPPRFHMAIVWRALRSYGMFESAPEVVMRADDALNEITLRMTLDQTPEIQVGGPQC